MLETHYGGPKRARSVAFHHLNKCQKLSVESHRSTSEVYATVANFADYCRQHGLYEILSSDSSTALDLYKKVLDVKANQHMIAYCKLNAHEFSGLQAGTISYLEKYLELLSMEHNSIQADLGHITSSAYRQNRPYIKKENYKPSQRALYISGPRKGGPVPNI